MSEDKLCPVCNGPMWDNRVKKLNPKAPDYKCKNKDCDGVIWPPKPKKVDKTPVGAQIAQAQFVQESQLQLLLDVLRKIEINTRPIQLPIQSPIQKTNAVGKITVAGITGEGINDKFNASAEEVKWGAEE